MSFSDKAKELLQWVLTVDDKQMEVLPVWVTDTGRLNEKRPAYVKMAVPDDWVKNLNGHQPQDVYLMVRIPHEEHERYVTWSGSPDSIKQATGIKIEGPAVT